MGVVGAGTISQRGVLPHLSQDDVADRVTLQAVCDPVPGRAEAMARKFGVARSYETYEELLAHGDVDAVVIASPIGLHYEQGRQALDAGKHVHFNKTMTTTVEEATDLIDRAAARGLRIVASPGEVLRPQNQAVRRLIASGAIGDLCWVACGAAFGTYHEDEPERGSTDAIDPSWYFRKPGGGPLYDMTVYALHGLTTVLGPARRVTAMSGVRLPERSFGGRMVPCEADDNTMILIDFGGSVYAFAYGAAAGSVTTGFSGSYFGTTGSIVGIEHNGTTIDYEGRALAESDPSGRQWVLPHVVGPHRHIGEHHVFEDIMQLVDSINDGTPTPVTAEHARHVIDIIESAYRAAESGQTQDLRTTFDQLRD
jgi:predicted dehydrogenase